MKKLEAYNFKKVSDYLSIDQKEAPNHELRMKQFLSLQLLDEKRRHAPVLDEDRYWHAMILLTQWYTEFTQRVFGYYVHHEPEQDGKVDEEERKASESTRREWFGASSTGFIARCSVCRIVRRQALEAT